MEWKVGKALNPDVERQQLNKVLADIRAAVSSVGTASTHQTGTTTINTITRYAVARFTLNLTGDVTGSALVDGLGDVTLETTLGDVEGFVEEAPIDSRYYWRRNGGWSPVPIDLAFKPEGFGFVVQVPGDEETTTTTIRELEVVVGELTVTDGDGQAGNPTFGLADVTDTGSGTGGVKLITRDSKGRITGTQNASTTNLPEGINLYYTDERAQDALAAAFAAGTHTNITITYNDVAGSFSFASTGGGGTGDVIGPASAVNNRVVFFDGTTGKLIKDSGLTLSGTNTGDQTSVTGNAGTATALATPRTIDGVSFDGTADITVIAPGTHAAATKATPIDADEFPLVDTAASNVLKKATFANLKATLKAYFDTLYSPAGNGSGAMMLVGTTTVTGSAATSMSMTGLNLSTDGEYYVEYAIENATGSTQNFSLNFNLDTTATNYDRTLLTIDASGVVTGGRANSASYATNPASSFCSGFFRIKNGRDSKPVAFFDHQEGQTTAIQYRTGQLLWRTASNVTSIQITNTVANSMAVGSYMRVWKIPANSTGSAWTTVKKTSDQNRASTTVMAADSELAFTAAAATRYAIRARIHFGIANATMDFKAAIAYSGTVTSDRGTVVLTIAGAGGSADNQTTATQSSIVNTVFPIIGTTSGPGYVEFEVQVLTNTAGTFSFQWAQNTSDVGNATVYAGSYLEYMQI